jgi:hypothetical protein
VSGKVASIVEGVPRVEVRYARHFAWGHFCFMMIEGPTGGNQRSRSLCTVADHDIYDPFPDKEYFVDRLGDPVKHDAAYGVVPED